MTETRTITPAEHDLLQRMGRAGLVIGQIGDAWWAGAAGPYATLEEALVGGVSWLVGLGHEASCVAAARAVALERARDALAYALETAEAGAPLWERLVAEALEQIRAGA